MNKIIDGCEKALSELEDRIHVLRKKIDSEELKEVKKLYSVEIGSIVVKNGEKFKVHSFGTIWRDSKPWLKCHKQLRDGTFGTAIHHVRDWAQSSWDSEFTKDEG